MKIILMLVSLASCSCFPVGTVAVWTKDGVAVDLPDDPVIVPIRAEEPSK